VCELPGSEKEGEFRGSVDCKTNATKGRSRAYLPALQSYTNRLLCQALIRRRRKPLATKLREVWTVRMLETQLHVYCYRHIIRALRSVIRQYVTGDPRMSASALGTSPDSLWELRRVEFSLKHQPLLRSLRTPQQRL
jgi:hypothetical protein